MPPAAFFLNPPSLPGSTANREGSAGMGALSNDREAFCYPPHLLAAAAAVFRRAGWRVAGLDAVAADLSYEETLDRLPRADVLVVHVSHASLAADRAFLNRLRERKPLLKVLAIGPALSYSQVSHALSDLADLLVAGEPELAMPAAARHLLAGDLRPGQIVNPYTLAHTAYRPDGTLVDLDMLPLPAWEIFVQQGYHYPFLTVLSSRGCPAGCTFCPYVAAQGAEYRSQSPGRTAEELDYLTRRFQPAHIMFRDPVFAYDRNRVLALCSLLRRRQPRLSWECESRPEHFDSRLLQALSAAGCRTIKLGLESTDPQLLVALGRIPDAGTAPAYVRQVASVVEECRRLGLLCRVFVMAGLPGQTLDAVRQTAAVVAKMRPARLHVKVFQWYPGIALPHANAPDTAQQVALLQAAGQWQPPRWRRLLRRLLR